jgi:hypothetical protein
MTFMTARNRLTGRQAVVTGRTPGKVGIDVRCYHRVLPRLASRWRRAEYGLSLLWVAILIGCSHAPSPVVIPVEPLYHVQPGTWRLIDEQILSASVCARHESEAYARISMDDWRLRVRRRTEEVFIPWYSSYWTQQWMATRVAWYKLQYTEGEVTPEERLLNYLQQQFYEQVLEPVRGFVDPRAVMDGATAAYLRELKDRLEQLPFEYRIPVAAFNQHLESIPALVVLAVPLQDASLYEVLQATDLSAVPAYEILLRQIAALNGGIGPTASADGLDRVARRAVTELLEPMALRGGATAAAALVGGFWGVLISTGAAAWSMAEHDREKPGLEAQLRGNLNTMLDVIWQDLVEDSHGGVTAVVSHMSMQIENAVFHPLQTPLIPYSPDPAGLF